MSYSRRNVYRDNRRLDGFIAAACLLAALFAACWWATDNTASTQPQNLDYRFVQ